VGGFVPPLRKISSETIYLWVKSNGEVLNRMVCNNKDRVKYIFRGIAWFILFATVNTMLRLVLSKNETSASNIIKMYITAVIAGFFFGLTLLQINEKYPKDITGITWFRFSVYFLWYIGVNEVIYTILYLKIFCPFDITDRDIVRSIPLLILFFPLSAFITGAIVFFVKKRRKMNNRSCKIVETPVDI
jgi:hypothetical protein